jgi:hypothetical protein
MFGLCCMLSDGVHAGKVVCGLADNGILGRLYFDMHGMCMHTCSSHLHCIRLRSGRGDGLRFVGDRCTYIYLPRSQSFTIAS